MNSVWKKVQKSKDTSIFKSWKRTFFQSYLVDTLGHFDTNVKQHYHVVSSSFSILSSKISRNMGQLGMKLRNATIYPPWSKFPREKILQKPTPPSSEMRNLFWRWHFKDIKQKNHGFEKSAALKITILRKVKWCGAF